MFILGVIFGLYLPSAIAMPLITEKRFYRPYGEAEQQTHAKHAVAKPMDAYCDSLSSLSNRRDARRCRIGKTVFDPCFLDEDKPSALLKCIASPWSKTYRLLRNRAIPIQGAQKALDMSKDWPWGIELVRKEHCYPSQQRLVFQGQAIRYVCENQGQLFGFIQHCKEPWSMLLKKPNGEVVSVAFERVWF